MDVVLLLMVLGVMLSGFWAADALDHIRKDHDYDIGVVYQIFFRPLLCFFNGFIAFETLFHQPLQVGRLQIEGIHHIMDLAGENFKGKITDYSARFFGLCEDCLKETEGNSDSSK